MSLEIVPCRDHQQLRDYIDQYWRKDHVLALDQRMFEFTYMTPWVDPEVFTGGVSVLCTYNDQGDLAGFLGSIVAPYPRPHSYWLALWHVLPETKGTGIGGQLLQAMQDVAYDDDGWIGTFGAGSEAVPVYLKRGYAVRGVRRWLFDGTARPEPGRLPAATEGEVLPPEDWLCYRYDQHPIWTYDRSGQTVTRTEENEWGVVTHVLLLGPEWPQVIPAVHRQAAELAGARPFMMDAWAFDCPGTGWTLAPDDAPSVFHPPEPRGNIIYASGRPYLPMAVGKGDCDQDRPN